jgi:hypothetical protein
MHMIAIRPETADFVIAAPSDYSLIPELCPSGEIVRIADSDDYFAVECQPRRSHLPVPSVTRLDPRSVANGLAPWATRLHRENAAHALVFHCGEPSPQLNEVVALSNAFVSQVDALSTKAPMPFRHHPLWPRTLEHHLATASVEQDPMRLAAITADPATAAEAGFSAASRLRAILLGRAPYFQPWHPRWKDAKALRKLLADVASNGRVAIVAEIPARVRLWLEREAFAAGAISVTHIPTAALRTDADAVSEGEAAFDCCVFLASDAVSVALPKILSCLAPLIKPGGAVVLCIGRIFSDNVDALPSIVPPSGLISADGRLAIETADGISAKPWRIAVQKAMLQSARNFSGMSSIGSIFSLVTAAGLAVISLCLNGTAVSREPVTGTSHFTSLFFTFRRSPIEAINGDRLRRDDETESAVGAGISEALLQAQDAASFAMRRTLKR